MMIDSETYYEEILKGKSASEILSVIRGLKRKINKLKYLEENPRELCMMHPNYIVQISCLYDYLERAKEAYAALGSEYVPTKAEQRAEKFNEALKDVSRVEFFMGYATGGGQKKTYTVRKNKVDTTHIAELFDADREIRCEEDIDAEWFIGELQALKIGEWRRKYDLGRFGFCAVDGIVWYLNIHFFGEHRSVRIEGENSYPYNFGNLIDLFEIEDIR